MSIDRRRVRRVTCGALTYPLVWGGAAAVGLVAGVTSDVETDTKGLGDAIAGFILGTLAFSVLWAIVMVVKLMRDCHPARAALAAFGTPTLVIAGMITSRPLGVALALTVPATAIWWATVPIAGWQPTRRRPAIDHPDL